MNAPRHECILLVDDDRNVTDALSMLLERDGRTTIVCSDLESADLALAHYPVTHIVTDVQFSGSFGFEGLHSLTRLRTQRPDCRIVVMTGYATDALRAAALAHGASAVLAKPFAIDDLEAALASTHFDDAAYELVRVPAIDEVLESNILHAAFQPIVHLSDCNPAFAFEALTRPRAPWSIGGPAELFDYAAKRERLTDLNVAALQCAIDHSAPLPTDAALFINVDPATFLSPSLVPSLRSSARRANLALDRIVLEITERSAFTDYEAATRVFEELRGEGVRFALDDHGSAYSHLAIISRIRPSFIKISSAFGTAFENDDTKQRIVRHVVALAHDFGAKTVLEGIECAATGEAAAAIGIDFAQGYYYGRPSPATAWTAGVPCAA